MSTPRVRRLRSLRVQVLLWTILPLTIMLLILTLTGTGSYQQSMRQLVADEQAHLGEVAAAAIGARLGNYTAQMQALAAVDVAQTGESRQVGNRIAGGMDVWHVGSDQPSAGGGTVPDWVLRALAARPVAVPVEEPWVWLDDESGHVVWLLALSGERGWLAGGVPRTALGLDAVTDVVRRSPLTTIALIDDRQQVVGGIGRLPDVDQVAGWTGVAEALAGEHGVQIADDGNRTDAVAYAPVAGLPWALIVREPLNELMVPLIHIEQSLPLILLAAASVSFLTLYFGLKFVVRPLRALALQAGRIGQGDFHAAEQSVGGVDEIEDLRLALDVMAHRIESDQSALQNYLRAITNAQEEERSRLARELHDETVQTLIALDHKVQMVQRTLDKHPERAREQVAELRKLIAGASQEVRRLSQALRPLYLEEVGLAPALEVLAREVGAEFCLMGTQCRLGPERELALFRIVQESISNAWRHAQASAVRVALGFGADTVTVGVGDNGIGFEVPARLVELTQQGHFGLVGIKERVQLIGGRLSLEARPGHGTIVIVDAPYADDRPIAPEDELVSRIRTWLVGVEKVPSG